MDGMDQKLVQRLSSQMARGEVILFTGAGFSLSARATSGEQVPSVATLRQDLWPLAFPGSDPDEGSTVGEIYENAIKRAGNAVRDLCQRLFTVDPNTLPDCYRVWLSAPWYRVYTLNVDDLEEAAARRFELPRRVRSISALGEPAISGSRNELLCIHLNGRVSEFPEVTFSPRQYGERTARPDPWYQHFVTDISSKPVVFVGTGLDEPPLWQHLAMRGNRKPRARELRPGSYLVTPSLSRARQGLLKDLNIDWVPMVQEEFAETVLRPLDEASRRGHDALARRHDHGGRRAFYIVGTEGATSQVELAEFLLGREPVWEDLTGGYAVARDFEDELFGLLDVDPRPRVAMITGTAGSGKSTTLRRVALHYRALGKTVAWIEPETEAPLSRLRRDVHASNPDVIVVDDVDSFGRAGAPLLIDLSNDTLTALVLGGARSTRFEQLDFPRHLRQTNFVQYTVPHLEDRDIDRLLDALHAANRLGQLRGKNRVEQEKAFREVAGRQLIVAMIEATSGERFDEKLARECEELGADAGLIYATVAVATSMRHFLTRDEVLIAIGDTSNEALGRLNALISQRLVVVTDGSQLRVRHRVVADKALDHFRKQGQLGEALRGLLFAIATKVHSDLPRRAREWQLLIRLLNHDFLIRLTDDRAAVRQAYEEIENLLSWDYHYWLQRGSFEVEAGDIRLAQNFLEQARSLAADDPMVQTEWSYMMLKRAYQDPANPAAGEWAEAAWTELEDAIQQRGRRDSYPYHVMGSQGLAWARRALVSDDEKVRILERLRAVVGEGRRLHPARRELDQLAGDVEKEYLMMSLPPEERRGMAR